MTHPAPAATPEPTRAPDHVRGWSGPVAKAVAATLGIARFVVPILAIPLVFGSLADDQRNVALLILLRPGRPEVLLAGFRIRGGGTSLGEVLLAYLPLGILSAWGFFWLGRLYADRFREDTPGWLNRIVPPEVFHKLQQLLRKRGPSLAVVGRVAGLPPTILAAAAAVSDVPARRYLAADLLGAAINVGIILGVGYGLGETYERAGPWITGVSLALVFAVSMWINAWIQRELEADQELGHDPETGADPEADAR